MKRYDVRPEITMKRYDCDSNGTYERPDGRFVQFSDVQAERERVGTLLERALAHVKARRSVAARLCDADLGQRIDQLIAAIDAELARLRSTP